MIIDAHQHFWSLPRADYGWLTPAAGVLYRDYLPRDLAPILKDHEVQTTLLVQAAPTEAETRFLFELAGAHVFIGGVIGWVDFEASDAAQRIAALAASGGGKLKGLRPMVQDLDDPDWLARPSLDAAFEAMTAHGLVFEALVRPRHLGPLRQRLLRHPRLRAVLDHAGKPDIAGGGLVSWAAELGRLARDTPICCKLSGLLNEAAGRHAEDDLLPYVSQVFDGFGPERILWGSDWPVLNAVATYGEWLALSRALVERCAPGRAAQVFAGTARRLYQLELQ
jgi:L-fuconolactonase